MHQLMLNLIQFSQFSLVTNPSQCCRKRELIDFRFPVMTLPTTKHGYELISLFLSTVVFWFLQAPMNCCRNMRVHVMKNDKFMIQNVFMSDKQTNNGDEVCRVIFSRILTFFFFFHQNNFQFSLFFLMSYEKPFEWEFNCCKMQMVRTKCEIFPSFFTQF